MPIIPNHTVFQNRNAYFVKEIQYSKPIRTRKYIVYICIWIFSLFPEILNNTHNKGKYFHYFSILNLSNILEKSVTQFLSHFWSIRFKNSIFNHIYVSRQFPPWLIAFTNRVINNEFVVLIVKLSYYTSFAAKFFDNMFYKRENITSWVNKKNIYFTVITNLTVIFSNSKQERFLHKANNSHVLSTMCEHQKFFYFQFCN